MSTDWEWEQEPLPRESPGSGNKDSLSRADNGMGFLVKMMRLELPRMRMRTNLRTAIWTCD